MTDQIRIEEPSYVAKYRASQAARTERDTGRETGRETGRDPEFGDDVDDSVPSYLRSYRAGGGATSGSLGGGTVNLAAATEGFAHPTGAPEPANDVVLVRHAEIDSLDEAGTLSDAGCWQARSYGARLAVELSDGERVIVGHADSDRAAATAEHVALGMTETCAERGREVEFVRTAPLAEFANLRFAGPTGPVDITEAFRALRTDPAWRFEGDPPTWAFELERLWAIQLSGGDPIAHWLTTPSLHAEPAPMVVRRVWTGIRRLGDEYPGARIMIATHAGVVRAFAIAALGYDPGDPYNAEHVRVQVLADRNDAIVSFRHRHQEICVPEIADLPIWKTHETWRAPARATA